ncbi:hypothetical protein [Hydrogenophaga sp. PBL-H3]|uniref:hypothetical protein n=1 Tax=Hydrogenophaga sp. PBL-H3 TaxID=434010 RepID=UPI00131FAAD0|nr:hypothetical protein [Hydrogenophaga sp. PBL-H3]QHE77580.1 hypothetical protein F9Z45_16850 [Hydrogenophaga sp. PBL-H3]QHE82004.1 hypothetical protein F9Z44_16850 [Hydrogenophaga sp. PBL-H3]
MTTTTAGKNDVSPIEISLKFYGRNWNLTPIIVLGIVVAMQYAPQSPFLNQRPRTEKEAP